MFTREMITQMVADAGFFMTEDGIPVVKNCHGSWQNIEYKIAALVQQVTRETLERAASECDMLSKLANHPDDVNGYGCASHLRSLIDNV